MCSNDRLRFIACDDLLWGKSVQGIGLQRTMDLVHIDSPFGVERNKGGSGSAVKSHDVFCVSEIPARCDLAYKMLKDTGVVLVRCSQWQVPLFADTL